MYELIKYEIFLIMCQNMHSPSTFQSCLKPATSPQVPKMYNKVQNVGLFPIDLNVTQLIFYHITQKRTV